MGVGVIVYIRKLQRNKKIRVFCEIRVPFILTAV